MFGRRVHEPCQTHLCVSKDIWEFLPGAFIGHVDEHENRNSRTPGKAKTALPPALTSASTSMEGTGWVIWTGVSVPKTNNVGSFVGQLRRSEGACVCEGGVDRKVQEVVFIFFRGISFSMFGCISLLVLIVKVTL